jgi:hypothetical protein
MIETDKLKTITLKGNNISKDNDVILFRDEMTTDPELREAILQYDEIVSEVANIEYERNKLVQAKFAMKSRLYNCALEFYDKSRTEDSKEEEDAN